MHKHFVYTFLKSIFTTTVNYKFSIPTLTLVLSDVYKGEFKTVEMQQKWTPDVTSQIHFNLFKFSSFLTDISII